MKRLANYLVESMVLDCQRLPNREEALQWFKDNNTFNILKDKLGETLTEKDINNLYDFAEQKNMPCPIVINYKNKKGHFVFRRWIVNKNLIDGFNMRKNKAPYDGLHDTNMKENGVWFPSAEDFESLIAYAHNKINKGLSDEENVKYTLDFMNKVKIQNMITYYTQNEESINNIVGVLNGVDLLRKSPEAPSTNTWKDLGEYDKYNSKVNNTPKTDLISKDKKHKISLKKNQGSQLMSGTECESRATLASCLDEIKNSEDRLAMENYLKGEWFKVDKSDLSIGERKKQGDKALLDADKQMKKDNEFIANIMQRNPDYKRAVALEAATGNIKFGGNDANANTVLVWDDVNVGGNKLYKIEDYVDHVMGGMKFNISFKSAGKRSWVVLRITTK